MFQVLWPFPKVSLIITTVLEGRYSHPPFTGKDT